jgi:hypothetical protein
VFALDTLLPVESLPVESASPVQVTRWRRFRQDRAYVQVHGRPIGYRDLRTGRIEAFRADDVDLIAQATADVQRDLQLV